MELAGSVALVTGASSGIGRAVALALAETGARLLLLGRDQQRLTEVATLCGGTPLVVDLADRQQRASAARKAMSIHGRLDVLVNDAGSGWSGPVTDMTAADVQRIVEVDLVAAIDLTRLLLPGMVERGSGAVCFVTSVAGRTGVAGEAVYSAAKAGLDAFAESLRTEAVGSGVQVSVVVPGAVDTPFFTARGALYERRLPRPVAPQAVAAAVVRAVVDDRAETWVPRWLRLAPAVRAVAPGPYRRLTAAFGGTQRLSARRRSSHEKPDRPAGSWP